MDLMDQRCCVVIIRYDVVGSRFCVNTDCYHSVHKSLCAKVDIVSVYICEALLVSCILPSAWWRRNVQFACLYIANQFWELAIQNVLMNLLANHPASYIVM